MVSDEMEELSENSLGGEQWKASRPVSAGAKLMPNVLVVEQGEKKARVNERCGAHGAHYAAEAVVGESTDGHFRHDGDHRQK